jgi:hypothetical protein
VKHYFENIGESMSMLGYMHIQNTKFQNHGWSAKAQNKVSWAFLITSMKFLVDRLP